MQYLALLFGQEDTPDARPGTPEFDAEVARYAAFEEKAGAAVAGGAALHPTATAINIRHTGGRTLVTDGPFTELAEVVGGFYVFEADDLDAAIGLAQQLPAADSGSIEVRPLAMWEPHGEIRADWWVALLWEPPGEVIAVGTPEWDAGADEHRRFAESAAGAIRGSAAMHSPSTATTVRARDGKVLLTDGPFPESAEVIDGLYLFSAPGRAEATEIAARIPIGAKGRVEVRPLVEMDA
ncbi:transcription initiation protein [Nocardia uniformis]|uniref:Transcription initiation protein n=1 Tax=Nocardia uniformis TaxID=53432 RepID=A0A849C7A5_9NOCA|nr:YciI family protein [Nocardia uniformis]NNH68861.1 transcription initiation protein [Nocardia uniformis]